MNRYRLLALSSTFTAVLIAAPAAQAAPPTTAELTACLGAKGTALPVFAKLKRGMTPEQVEAVWPGAGKPEKSGYAKVKAERCAGATGFKLFFYTDKKAATTKLVSAKIDFDGKLTGDADFYKRLVDILVAKFGPAKPKDIEEKIIAWSTKAGAASLSPTGPGGGFELGVPLE
jgi:hypothetical protein